MTPVQAPGREAGLTIIEVIVAAFVLVTVATAVGLATVSDSRMRGSVKLQVALTKVAQQATEDIATDRSWMRGCRRIDVDCRINTVVRGGSLELDGLGERAQLRQALATPLDSGVDGTGADDADGVTPDYYRIRVEIRPSTALARRFSTTPADSARNVVTTIDPRGEQAFGSLAIEACVVRNQSDERMSIQGCTQSGTSPIRMAGCPTAPSTCSTVFSFVGSRGASETEPSPFVVMRRVPSRSLGIVVRGSSGWVGTAADAKLDPQGRLLFENVPAGEVRIFGLPATAGANTERWTSKDLPTNLSVGSPLVIEPGVRSRALAMYRPTRTRGVDLYFQRRTYTLRLGGPKDGYNRVVAPWARTHSYTGVQAQKICDALGSAGGDFRMNTMWCEGKRSGPGRNCVTVIVGLQDYVQDPNGMFFIDEGMLGDITPGEEENYPPEIRMRQVEYHGLPAVITCTWYWEEYFTKYYSYDSQSMRVRAGIVEPITYSTTPMPENRYVEMAGGLVRRTIPQCRAERRSQCSAPGGAYPDSLRSMVPGLNQGLRATNDGTGMSAGRADAINTRHGVAPAAAWSTLRSPALWVRPSGTILGSNGGSVAPGTRITLTGEGECYWRSPLFAGEAEGSCSPCRPTWKPGITAVGCSLLTRVNWKRHAKETREYLPLPGMNYPTTREEPIAGAEGRIDFNPPLVCVNPEPRVIGGCRPMPTGGGGGGGGGGGDEVPDTRHPAPASGGAGGVRSHAVTQPAAA